MLYKKGRTLYLQDNLDRSNEILLYSSYYFGDIDFRILLSKKRDAFITIDKSEQGIYDCFKRCYDSIMNQYESEDESYKKSIYESIWFVDIYDDKITFYSDKCYILESHAFSIKKNKKDESFEVGLSYNKYASSVLDSINLTNDFGVYEKYIKFLDTLHSELQPFAIEKEEPKIEQEPYIHITQEPKKPLGVKGLIKTIFKGKKY